MLNLLMNLQETLGTMVMKYSLLEQVMRHASLVLMMNRKVVRMLSLVVMNDEMVDCVKY